jgi:putative colanic acid biosynthesis UDP-glucose lipid carrier transferase
VRKTNPKRASPHLNSSIRPRLELRDMSARLLPGQPGVGALLRGAIDPCVALLVLASCVAWYGGRFTAAYLVLALLVFALTFPGNLAVDGDNAGTQIRRIFGGWFLVVAVMLLLGWTTATLGAFDMRVLLAWALITPLAMFAAHRLVPVVLPRLLAAESVQKVAVIAGANEVGRRLAERVRADPLLGVRVAGFFDDRTERSIEGIAPQEKLGSLGQLAAYAKTHRVDVIYITLPLVSQPRIMQLIEELRDTTASIYFAPDIFLCDLIQAHVELVGGMPVVAVCESPFYGVDGLVKRVSDLVLASLILVAILPLMLAIAAGVKLSSPGPAIFRQRRYGLDGREIVVYKFRTMRVLEDGSVIRQATADDPRITPLGAFLRKYSLDELPQFINVLQGRMSVVGPRPHAVAHNEQYRKLIRGYMIRHKVRPGITGLAQVNGFRGETDALEKMQARIECDLAYLRHWSLALDLSIVFQTVAVVLRPQNAH